ncbi:MAG TPA: hypothetical protein VFO41_16795 [Alphaproteobacteria bacterium]|nr:hypothetical protein [Alphaproteobacteria bacterium]
MPTDLRITNVFSADIEPQVALTICEMYARSLIASHDDGDEIPQEHQDIFAAMLAEIFDYEVTRDYLSEHKQGAIVEWMTRFPSGLEKMLHRFVQE